MYAINFETDVKNEYIKIPEYDRFKFKHVKVVLMVDSEEKTPEQQYKFDDLMGQLEWNGDAVAAQRELRDEW